MYRQGAKLHETQITELQSKVFRFAHFLRDENVLQVTKVT